MEKCDIFTGMYLYCPKCDVHSEQLKITNDEKYYSRFGMFCLKHYLSCGEKYDDDNKVHIVYRSYFTNVYLYDNIKWDREFSYKQLVDLHNKKEKDFDQKVLKRNMDKGMSEFESYKIHNARKKISDFGIDKDG